MIRITFSILLLLSVNNLVNGWKTDPLEGCPQEDANEIDIAFGKILLIGGLRIPFVDDLPSTNVWCK